MIKNSGEKNSIGAREGRVQNENRETLLLKSIAFARESQRIFFSLLKPPCASRPPVAMDDALTAIAIET